MEDSGADSELFDRLRAKGFKIIINGRRMGQLPSIDVAYAECSTEFILHCEDDWEFSRRPNVEAACRILKEGIDGEGQFSVVCFRDSTGTKHGKPELFSDHIVEGSLYRYSLRHKYDFNYFSFNPGILRYDLYERYGPWTRYDDERSIARMMRANGHCIVRELPGNVQHIGKGRSRIRSHHFRRLKNTARKWLGFPF